MINRLLGCAGGLDELGLPHDAGDLQMSGDLQPSLVVDQTAEGAYRLVFSGDWTGKTRPSLDSVLTAFSGQKAGQAIIFDTTSLGAWDSYFLISLERIRSAAAGASLVLDERGLPQGVRGLLELARAVPERAGASRTGTRPSFLELLGRNVLGKKDEFMAAVSFAGQLVLGIGRVFTGRADYRRSDLFLFMQETGAEALPIVTLISVLVGMILAFVGAIQLQMFGAEIYVADLVGVGMAMEMGALMTGIIMAGRTGASYAAQLGTMQVNEEIDAMSTMGISPFDFLVLPRTLALILMMPLLCLYADILGMLGGALVGLFLLDLEPTQYFQQTASAVTLSFFAQGLIKASVFGMVIAFCGCLQGMRCGRSAQAVGEATTRAVVQCIIWIVVTDTVLTLIYIQTGF